jgi:hypothetical protein
MPTYITRDGAFFKAAGPEELLHQLRQDSRDPRESDLAFRLATARAATLQTGRPMRANSPAALVEDLIRAGLLRIEDDRPWPAVGQKATLCHGHGLSPCTITEVAESGETIRLQADQVEVPVCKWSTRPKWLDSSGKMTAPRLRYRPRAGAPVCQAQLQEDGHYRTAKGERVLEFCPQLSTLKA